VLSAPDLFDCNAAAFPGLLSLKLTKFSSIKKRICISLRRAPTSCLETAMPSILFFLGYLLMVVVVSWLAYLSHIPEPYIFAMVVIMLCIGAVSGLEHDRQKNSPY
jgi:hypothetical protein